MGKKNSAASIAADRYVPPFERKSGWDDYEVKDALRTLSQAEKIRRNKPLMAAIRKEAAQQLKVAQATAQQLQGGK